LVLQGLFCNVAEELTGQAKEATKPIAGRYKINGGKIGEAPAFCYVSLK
jgi:hypothetical protein